MCAMRAVAILCLLKIVNAFAVPPAITASDFRASLGAPYTLRLSYRGPDCQTLCFDSFARAMAEPCVHSDIERAVARTAVTVTARRKGGTVCSSPYPPVTELPPFELRDLAGKHVNA